MFTNYKEMKQYIESMDKKSTLLLHSCCAPCSSHVLLLLSKYFDITIYYSNDNIYPEEEYHKRLEEQKRFASNVSSDIQVISDGYDANCFYEKTKGLEKLGERSARCYACYELRLTKTAQLAQAAAYDFFTTTLSISPYKNSAWINEIGLKLEKEYKVMFLYSDFKKEQGYQHSITLSKEYALYRQSYCGCIYSYEERRLHQNEQEKNNKNKTLDN